MSRKRCDVRIILPEVAVVLGHSNIKITQRRYNARVQARQTQLEENVEKAWAWDVWLQASGTQAVRKAEVQKSNLFTISGNDRPER